MADKTRELVANRLKRARVDAGLTQDELAEKAALSTNYLARIERAEVKPSVEILEKIVKALNLKSSDILPF